MSICNYVLRASVLEWELCLVMLTWAGPGAKAGLEVFRESRDPVI